MENEKLNEKNSDQEKEEDLEEDEDLMHDEFQSSMFDSDSSAEGEFEISPDQVHNLAIGLQDIEKEVKPEIQEEEELQREEMGGVLVYDSNAKIKGCQKIEDYWTNRTYKKVQTDFLFSKQELKEVTKDLFTEKARERDFYSDQDKNFFKNLPRFHTQRDYINLHQSLPVPNLQNVLIFDSRFENGNLRKAAKVSNVEYNLWLENDVHTRGHTQWYFFKVIYQDIALHSDKKVQRIKFNILNLAKTSSLYQVGMKPCIWSRRKFEKDGTGWFRGGENITYTQNQISRYDYQPPKTLQGKTPNYYQNLYLMNTNGAGEGVDFYYTFSFTYEFEANINDELLFAHAIPYTYSELQEKLAVYKKDPELQSFLKMNVLCFSLAKTPVPLLTITENIETYLDYYEEVKLLYQIPNILKKSYRQKYQKVRKLARQGEDSKGRVRRLLEAAFEEEIKCFFEYNEDNFLTTSPSFAGFGTRLNNFLRDHSLKKTIFITSRVHPGEPQASHMLDGLLEYLLSKDAEPIRRHFVIRIVPMLNPDGVIYGNYRCSLLGCDLNRKWEKPNRLLHPEIFYTKQLIRHMHTERKVVLYTDFHGHSRKQNAFFYGCSYKNYEQEGRVKNAQLRIIPLLCCQKNSLFSLKDCRFTIEKAKESTGRVVVFREMNIMNSFTLECSFFGKEWNPQTESMCQEKNEQKSFSKVFPDKKKKLLHMSQSDYNSLGKTFIQVMYNYLPSEQSKLQFISGKILDVFYDEFIKFIPPYILKREEEKRKKAEQGDNTIKQNKKGEKSQAGAKNTIVKQDTLIQSNRKRNWGFNNGAALNFNNNKFLMNHEVFNGATNSNQKQRNLNRFDEGDANFGRGSDGQIKRNMLSASNRKEFQNIQVYDRRADRSLATRTRVANEGINGEESSDAKQILGLSGNDDDNDDHFNALINIPHNQNEIFEFENFMNGISNKLKEKDKRRKQKLDNLLQGLISREELGGLGDVHSKIITHIDIDLSDDSGQGSSSDELTYQQKKNREQKQKKQIEKILKKIKNDKKEEEIKLKNQKDSEKLKIIDQSPDKKKDEKKKYKKVKTEKMLPYSGETGQFDSRQESVIVPLNSFNQASQRSIQSQDSNKLKDLNQPIANLNQSWRVNVNATSTIKSSSEPNQSSVNASQIHYGSASRAQANKNGITQQNIALNFANQYENGFNVQNFQHQNSFQTRTHEQNKTKSAKLAKGLHLNPPQTQGNLSINQNQYISKIGNAISIDQQLIQIQGNVHKPKVGQGVVQKGDSILSDKKNKNQTSIMNTRKMTQQTDQKLVFQIQKQDFGDMVKEQQPQSISLPVSSLLNQLQRSRDQKKITKDMPSNDRNKQEITGFQVLRPDQFDINQVKQHLLQNFDFSSLSQIENLGGIAVPVQLPQGNGIIIIQASKPTSPNQNNAYKQDQNKKDQQISGEGQESRQFSSQLSNQKSNLNKNIIQIQKRSKSRSEAVSQPNNRQKRENNFITKDESMLMTNDKRNFQYQQIEAQNIIDNINASNGNQNFQVFNKLPTTFSNQSFLSEQKDQNKNQDQIGSTRDPQQKNNSQFKYNQKIIYSTNDRKNYKQTIEQNSDILRGGGVIKEFDNEKNISGSSQIRGQKLSQNNGQKAINPQLANKQIENTDEKKKKVNQTSKTFTTNQKITEIPNFISNGSQGNSNFIRPQFIQQLDKYASQLIKSDEINTAYQENKVSQQLFIPLKDKKDQVKKSYEIKVSKLVGQQERENNLYRNEPGSTTIYDYNSLTGIQVSQDQEVLRRNSSSNGLNTDSKIVEKIKFLDKQRIDEKGYFKAPNQMFLGNNFQLIQGFNNEQYFSNQPSAENTFGFQNEMLRQVAKTQVPKSTELPVRPQIFQNNYQENKQSNIMQRRLQIQNVNPISGVSKQRITDKGMQAPIISQLKVDEEIRNQGKAYESIKINSPSQAYKIQKIFENPKFQKQMVQSEKRTLTKDGKQQLVYTSTQSIQKQEF